MNSIRLHDRKLPWKRWTKLFGYCIKNSKHWLYIAYFSYSPCPALRHKSYFTLPSYVTSLRDSFSLWNFRARPYYAAPSQPRVFARLLVGNNAFTQIWVVLVIGWSKISHATNQKHYPDLDSDASSVWNFCSRFSDVISRGKARVVSQNDVGWFLRLKLSSICRILLVRVFWSPSLLSIKNQVVLILKWKKF